ncbi:hypothetical protein ACFL1I_08670, partial [Candidatus Omnitrophota bacterium]
MFATGASATATEQMRIDSAGNVGIGTAGPELQLDLYRNDAAVTPQFEIEQEGTGDAVMRFELSGTKAYSMGIDNSDSDKFKISDFSGGVYQDTLLTIHPDGNVGIGTTDPDRLLHPESSTALTNTVSYGQRLSHITSGVPANNIGVGIEFEQETAADNNEIGAIMEVVATDTTATNEDFDIVFKNMAAGAAAAETFRIDSTGNITAQGTISGTISGYVKTDGTTPMTADWDIGDTRMIQADKIQARDGAGLALYEDGGAGIFVEDGGQVGIGTAGPSASLYIDDDGLLPALIINKPSTARTAEIGFYSADSPQWYFGTPDDDTGVTGNEFFIGQTSKGTGADFFIETDGNVGIGTVSPDRLLHPESSTALTNTVSYGQRLSHITSGVPANNIGIGIEFEQETAADNNEIGAIMEVVATDTTATNEDFDFVFKNMAAGAAAAETFRIDSTGNITASGTLTGVTTAITGTKNNALAITIPTQGTDDAVGVGMTISADDGGSGGTGNAGGDMLIEAGAAAGGNNNGGIFTLRGGALSGSGADGYVRITDGTDTPGNTLDDESLFVKGILEVDGVLYADGGVSGVITPAGDLEMGDTPYSIDGGTSGLTFDPDNDNANEVTISTAGLITSVGLEAGAGTVNATGMDAGDGNIANVGEIAVDKLDDDNGAIAIGDNDETVAVDSSDWDINA